MKFILAFMGVLGVCCANAKVVTKWGITNGRILDAQVVEVNAYENEYQVRVLTYPNESKQVNPIIGMKHFDYAASPINVTIIDGGMYRKTIALLLKSQPNYGINSTFVFYGM